MPSLLLIQKLTHLLLLAGSGFLLQRRGSASAQQAVASVDDFVAARALWLNLTQGLPSDYTFIYFQKNTEGMAPSSEPYAVDVRSDVVTNVYPATGSFMVGDNPLDPADFPTIPELFDRIEDAMNGLAMSQPIVEYNDQYGYPSSISIVYTQTQTVQISVSELTPYTLLEDDLDAHEALWQSHFQNETGENYSYEIQVYCFCFAEYVTPKRIVVQNGTIVSTIDITTGTPYVQDQYDTISAQFDRIRRSIANYDVSILISYDDTLGYPTSISTNPEYGLADAGMFIEIRNVTLEVGFDNEVGNGNVTAQNTSGPTAMTPTRMPSSVSLTAAPVQDDRSETIRPAGDPTKTPTTLSLTAAPTLKKRGKNGRFKGGN